MHWREKLPINCLFIQTTNNKQITMYIRVAPKKSYFREKFHNQGQNKA